jgi:diguanylate cyclase
MRFAGKIVLKKPETSLPHCLPFCDNRDRISKVGASQLNRDINRQDAFTRARDFVAPPVSEEIRGALDRARFESVRLQVPMLLGVAALNVMIVMAMCAYDGMALQTYAWMAGLVLYCAVRGLHLQRIMAQPLTPDQAAQMPKNVAVLGMIMITGLSIMTCYTFMTDVFSSGILIPVSLAFGATSISHCLYTLRPAALGVLVLGIMPPAAAMIVTGSFQAIMLGIALMSVAVLMIRFVSAQYDQLVTSLFLEKQIRDLANTDALTGLANRRAIMAALEEEEENQSKFGLALLDLDGFKAVNDTHGHHVGDSLLQHVSTRLLGAVQPRDSVGRLGGDEFIVLFRDVISPADMTARAAAIITALCEPVTIGAHNIFVGASLGSALYAEPISTVADMLITADKALYAQKSSNKQTAARTLQAA